MVPPVEQAAATRAFSDVAEVHWREFNEKRARPTRGRSLSPFPIIMQKQWVISIRPDECAPSRLLEASQPFRWRRPQTRHPWVSN